MYFIQILTFNSIFNLKMLIIYKKLPCLKKIFFKFLHIFLFRIYQLWRHAILLENHQDISPSNIYHKLKSLFIKIQRTSPNTYLKQFSMKWYKLLSKLKVDSSIIKKNTKPKIYITFTLNNTYTFSKDLCSKNSVISDSLKNKVGVLLFNCLYSLMLRLSQEDNIS